MTLPMVTCPLCCRPGFSTSDSLCSALVDITTRKLCCPICNHVVVGLDKFTIHLFSHSLNKFRTESGKESVQIVEAENTTASITNNSSNLFNNRSMGINFSQSALKIQSSSSTEESIAKTPENHNFKVNNTIVDTKNTSNIPDNPLICFRADNGQLFVLPSECLGPSLKNVTINTQNYITNTNITTSTVQTSVVEKVQKRKYSQVFENECSENLSKCNDANSPDNYSNVGSVSSWPSTPSVSSEAEKPSNYSNEREFESCKDLLTKGDFSTLSDEIGDLDIKKESNFTDSMTGDELIDDTDDRKDDEKKKDSLSCDLCTFTFPNKTILAMHKQLIHKKEEVEVENKRKLLICNLCPRTFSLRSSLMIHKKVAHAGGFGNNETQTSPNQSPSKPACHICGKFFKKDIHLAQHMKAHDEKQWQCTICSKTFTTKYFLKKHRRLHTGETPYKCTKCNKAFTFQQSYHKHLLYHNDEKPYCCAQCGRLFKELSTLHNHERIHSGEKPFSCETCGKAFRQRVSYLVHRRIHTGAMPYKCTACNKSFRYKISQRTHKCTAQPPGIVVRTSGSLVERLQAAMSKAAVEIDQSPATENLDKRESSVMQENESEMENVMPSLANKVNKEAQTSMPSSIPITLGLSQASEHKSVTKIAYPPENLVGKNPTPNKIQVGKPQIYLLVKGPNDETFYQPLIISQTIGINSVPKSTVIPNQCIISETSHHATIEKVPEMRNPHGNDMGKNKDTSGSDYNTNESKCSNNNVESISNYVSLTHSNKHSNFENVRNEESISKSSEWLKTELYLNNRSSEKEENAFQQFAKNSEVDEILDKFSYEEHTKPEYLKNMNKEANNNLNNKSESNSDLTIMESPDIFSYIMSPSLSSPSDRFGKMSLSSSSSTSTPHQQLDIESFDTPDPFNINNNPNPENQQESLFDSFSDDALKEFLFGTST